MRIPHISWLIAVLMAAQLLNPALIAAQSVNFAAVSGTIRGSDGRVVPGALVSIDSRGAGSSSGATTTVSGAFTIDFLTPGSYRIRVEAVGYRPLIAQTLTLRGGEISELTLTLTISPPPVLEVDTIELGGRAAARLRGGGLQLGLLEIDEVPHRFDDLSSIMAFSTLFDPSFGAQGLPGDMSLMVADGVPVYRAPHPTARTEYLPGTLFPRSALSSATAFHNPPDIEWTGAAGGFVSVGTRSSTRDGGLELDGGYSADPLWSSGEADFATPGLTSYQAGLRTSVPLTSDASRLVLSGEALRHQTPLTPRVSESLAGELAALDPDILASLTAPSVERYDRFSGLARIDAQRGRSGSVFFRGAGSYVRRTFDGAGPASLPLFAAPAEESIDFSVAGGLVSELTPRVSLELRAGGSGSYRDFGPASADTPPAYLAEAAVPVGSPPSAAGESARTDFVLLPVVHYAPSVGGLKIGGNLRVSSHMMDHSGEEFLYSSPAALLGGQGFGQSSFSPRRTFTTDEYGVFAQFEGPLGQGVRVSVAGRYGYESFRGEDIQANADWREASGLQNEDIPNSFHQFGVRGSLSWEPLGGEGTSVFLTGSMREGDVDQRALYQLFSQGTEATSTRYAGSDVMWPSGGIPPLAAPDLPSLTLLGPDTRAPRSIGFTAGILQDVGDLFSISVEASQRRTDFLMRRRNLNVPLVAQAVDPNGLGIIGTLAQDGALVTTTDDDARRFPAFGEVWALDPDGWSEFRGISVLLEHRSSAVDLYGAYTYSETTDNWVGAASGSIDAALLPGLPESAGGSEWAEATSDFDIPHRIAAGASVRLDMVTISGAYHYRSGLPFTPGYRLGVDANGDGSARNDVAFVPGDSQVTTLLDEWPCLESQAGTFAKRNSCRGPQQHTLDARLRIGLGRLAGRDASLVFDALNLIEGTGGVLDEALLLVDPAASITTSPDGSIVTIPVGVNPGFGEVLYPATRGRMLRLGMRIGA